MASNSKQSRYEKLLAKQPSQSTRRRSSGSSEKFNSTTDMRSSYADLHKVPLHSKQISFGSSYDSRVEELTARRDESVVAKFHPAFKAPRVKRGVRDRKVMPTPSFARGFPTFPSFMSNAEDRIFDSEDGSSRNKLPTQRQFEVTGETFDTSTISRARLSGIVDQTRLYDDIVQLDTMINEEINYHHAVNSQPAKPYETSPIKVDLMTSYHQAISEIAALKQEILSLDEQEQEYRKMNDQLLKTIELQEHKNDSLRSARRSSKANLQSRPVSLKMCPPILPKLNVCSPCD